MPGNLAFTADDRFFHLVEFHCKLAQFVPAEIVYRPVIVAAGDVAGLFNQDLYRAADAGGDQVGPGKRE